MMAQCNRLGPLQMGITGHDTSRMFLRPVQKTSYSQFEFFRKFRNKPFHVQQSEQIRAYRQAWKEAGHKRTPRISVSRSIFALIDERDRMYFGNSRDDTDKTGYLEENNISIFGRSYAAAPDVLIKELAKDEAIAEADTLLLTIPNQLGVDYNAHIIKSVLTYIAPSLGWR